MENLIIQAFQHIAFLNQHVRAGRYYLEGPDGDLILKEIWSEMIQPGWTIVMKMLPDLEDVRNNSSQPLGQQIQAQQKHEQWTLEYHKRPNANKFEFCDWEHFKNHYTSEGDLKIIEILCGHPQLRREVEKENLRSMFAKAKPLGAQDKPVKVSPPQDSVTAGGNVGKPGESVLELKETWWSQRVRIHSSHVVLILSRLAGQRDWVTDSTPIVFFRPFKTLFYLYSDMKKCLEILEAKCAAGEAQGWEKSSSEANANDVFEHVTGSTAAIPHQDEQEVHDNPQFPGIKSACDPESAVSEVSDIITASNHMQTYLEFVEKHILPVWKSAMGTSQKKIRFCDLWMSFVPGELLYIPPMAESDRRSGRNKAEDPNRTVQSLWRLFSLWHSPDYGDFVNSTADIDKGPDKPLELECYHIDFDGVDYVPVEYEFLIEPFDGEKDITSLPIYPFRFAKDRDRKRKEFSERGIQFQHFIRHKHLFYNGWTITHDPTDNPNAEDSETQEYIEGEVIIDFLEGFKGYKEVSRPSSPDWLEDVADSEPRKWSSCSDPLPTKYWTNANRLELLGESTDRLQIHEIFFEGLIAVHKRKNKFIQAWESGHVGQDYQIEEDDLGLLPQRLIAYSFRERKFFRANLQYLSTIPEPENAFEDLKINMKHKDMLQAIVSVHFEKQTMQREHPNMTLSQDFIRGKGSGVGWELNVNPTQHIAY